jgi:hypothetical protein
MSNRIRIGWAQRDITPDRPVALRGQFNMRIATRVQDPLTLTALVLQSGDTHVVLVSMDACGVDAEVLGAARQELPERLPDFDPEMLIVNATHTHTAPFAGAIGLQKDDDYLEALLAKYPDYMSTSEYSQLLTETLIEAVCEAWEQLDDGSIGFGYSYAVVGENRRVRYFDNSAQMYGSVDTEAFSHIEGHVDHSVNLLFTYDAEQRLTGVLVNQACPSQASESGQDFISADFWHDVREELRRRYHADLFVLPQCSAAGDQSPHRLVAKAAEDRMLRLKYGSGLERPLNASLRKDIARRLADATDDAEPAARKDLRDTAILRAEHHTLELDHWDVTDEEYATAVEQVDEYEQQLAELGDADVLSNQYTYLKSRIAWYRRAIGRYEEPLESVPSEVNVFRLGDIAFVTVPFEYYLDFGDRIKGRSAAVQTFVVQLAGGGSYLATERAAAGLSYGAIPSSCKVSPKGGQQIVDAAVRILDEMFGDV